MVNDWTFYAQKNQTYLRITNTYSAGETLRLYKVTGFAFDFDEFLRTTIAKYTNR